MKNSQWIWQGLIALAVLVPMIVFGFITAKRDLTDFESLLLQFIFLSIGCGVSYWVGQKSVKKATNEILKPHALGAVRYLISLNKSISRARTLASIGLPQRLETNEDYHVIRGALIAILYDQIEKTNDALEDWRDILEEELEAFIQKLREESATSEESENYIQQFTHDNIPEDKS